MSMDKSTEKVKTQDIASANEDKKLTSVITDLRRYKLLFETAQEALLFMTMDGFIFDVNSSALAIYGYSLEELLTMKVYELRENSSSMDYSDVDGELLSGGVMLETTHKKKDGTIFPVETLIRSAYIDDEKILIAAVKDISERKRHEKEKDELLLQLDYNYNIEKRLAYAVRRFLDTSRKLGEYTFAALKTYIEKASLRGRLDEKEILEQLTVTEELYGDYLSIVQTSSAEFRQKNLAADLEKYLQKVPDVQNLTVKADGQENISYFGNYRIIFFIMHSILKYMFIPEEKYIIVCNISGQPQETVGKLPIMLEMNFENRISLDRSSELWETVKGFISEVCKLTDTKMEMHIRENNLSLKLIIDFLDSTIQAANNNS